MKASRKGTRLNDAHYFRQPLPHLRKRMTTVYVLPKLSNKANEKGHQNVAENRPSTGRSSGPTTASPRKFIYGSKSEREKLDFDQRSVEMGLVSYSSISTSECSLGTSLEPPFRSIPAAEVVAPEKLRSPEKFTWERVQECVDRSVVAYPWREVSVETDEIPEEKPKTEKIPEEKPKTEEIPEEKSKTISEQEDEKPSPRRDGGLKQMLMDFFAQILGKRGPDAACQGHRKNFFGINLNRIFNGGQAHPGKRSAGKRRIATAYTARSKAPRDAVLYELTREIGLDRDEKLRATPVGRRLRTRMLEEEVARRYGKALVEKPRIRLSSPLY